MDEPLEVVIAGGGVAGWMTAAALAGLLSPAVCRVRVIEDAGTGAAVGEEAALPGLRRFNAALGLAEPEVMRRTEATFRLGTEFVGWGGDRSSYFHPFDAPGRPLGGVAFHHQWARARLNGRDEPIEAYSFAAAAARAGRFGAPDADRASVRSFDYALHLDGGLYAGLLREFAEARGATRTAGRIADVALAPASGVASVRLASGEVVAGDLFVDCTEHRALLIGEAMASPYEDWSHWLPCDGAWTAWTARGDAPLAPCTTATADEAGWRWRIPLRHRTGHGYAFASRFLDKDAALGRLLDGLDGSPDAAPRLTRFRPGRRPRAWQGNCVAIGAAAGFIEPLEASGLHLVQAAIAGLLRLFPDKRVDPALPAEFNRLMNAEFERVRDLLVVRYRLNGRDDGALWRHCRGAEAPDGSAARLDLFAHSGALAAGDDGPFAPRRWLSALLGQGAAPVRYHPLADNLAEDLLFAELDALRARIAAEVAGLPPHERALEDHLAAAPAGSPGRAAA